MFLRFLEVLYKSIKITQTRYVSGLRARPCCKLFGQMEESRIDEQTKAMLNAHCHVIDGWLEYEKISIRNKLQLDNRRYAFSFIKVTEKNVLIAYESMQHFFFHQKNINHISKLYNLENI